MWNMWKVLESGECVDWFIWISPSCGLPTVAECGKTGSAKNKENFAHD